MIERASRSQIDLGIAATARVENPAVTRRLLTVTHAVCAFPKGHALAALRQISPKDIAGMNFISLGNMDGLRLQIDQACDEAGVGRTLRIECTLASACLEFVASGAGITIVDDISAWAMRHAVAFRPFVPELQVELSLYRPWGTLPTVIGTAFTEHLVREIRALSKKALVVGQG